jgi:hypothetical protein
MISWSTQRMKSLNTWLLKHLMAIITDSTSRLGRNIPMPRQRGNGRSAAAVLGWSRMGGGSGGILAVTAAAWQALQRCYRGSGGGGDSSGSVVAAWWRQWWRRGAAAAWRWWQCGGGRAAADSVAAVWASAVAARQQEAWRRCRQRSSGSTGSTPVAAGLAAVVEVWRHCSVSGGSRAVGAALLLRAATVAMKTPAATAMVGALPTTNNKLKASATVAMETMTTTTNKM